ncbi:MAG: hypothetical protein QGG36_25075 [Pirellulaceae bacterium]|nr:hypothetical protein [Pirellulaceae bacterium]MDP7019094.1 hypothetical protein [Pirellulaceae bacterium]
MSALFVAALAWSGFGSHSAAAAEPPKPSDGLVRVPLADLPFIHDALRQRIHRIDKIMGGANYPADKTIKWSRRPHAGRDGTGADDFVAQWSTATDRLGVSIQPGQEPASTVRIYAEVGRQSAKSKQGPRISGFNLRGSWRPKAPGWGAMVVIFSSRSYTAAAAGRETIRVHFRHSDRTTINLPLAGWVAATPTSNPRLPTPRGFKETRIASRGTRLSIAQVRALTESAESFRDEAIRLISAVEASMIADIVAGRGVQRGVYRQVDNDGNTRFVAFDSKDVQPLSGDEIEQFRNMVKKEFQRRRSIVQENYKELHPAILNAFPLDQYAAAEPISAAP